MLYDHSDAVYIASPHNTHYGYIKDALQHGKHVLCEKPMVLKKEEAEELFDLAEKSNVILMEAVKTAYCPGFIKLVSTVKSGHIGKVYDVEAGFTKLIRNTKSREFDYNGNGGSFTELATYPLLAIVKILGRNYKDICFQSFFDDNGIDIYTKAYLRYENAVATVKVGIGVKSEGNLIASASNGYLIADSPWWLTKNFELKFEDPEMNEKYFEKFLGQGLRYEIAAFINKINGHSKYNLNLTKEDSIFFSEIIEKYLLYRKETLKEG